MKYIKVAGITLVALWFLVSVAIAAIIIMSPDAAGILE